MANIRRQSIKAFIWNGIGQYSSMALSFLTAAILGRLLDPTDFGLVGMILTINAFLVIFANTGLSTTIVQHKEFGTKEISSLFSIALLTGLLATAVLALLAPVIAYFYHEHKLVNIALVVSPTFLLTALTQVPQGLLQRNLQFKLLSIANVGSALISSVISIYLAYIGWGYWSLIVQLLLKAIILLLLCIVFAKQSLNMSWDVSLYKRIYGFTGNLTLFQIVNYFQRNLDNILIGRRFGAASLGIYSRAYLVMSTYNTAIGGVISSVLHPTLAKKQDDVSAMTRGYSEIVQYILWISAPVMGFFAAFAPQFIYIIWGSKWERVVPSFFWLALAGMHQSVLMTFGAVFAARYKTKPQFVCGLITTVLLVLAIISGLPYGISGVARAYSIMSHIIFFPYLYYIWCKVLNGKFKDFLKIGIPPMAFGWAILIIVYLTTDNKFPNFGAGQLGLTPVAIVAILLWAMVMLWVFWKTVVPSLKRTFLSKN